MTETITDRQFEIIEAAGKILTQSGVSGLTIKNLAKEMRFSESAIYRHFSSKEEIVIAMLNYLVNSMDERYSDILDNDLGPEEKFIALFQSQFSFFENNEHFVVAVFSDGFMEESQQINLCIKKIMTIKIKHLAPIIIAGQKMNYFTNDLSTEELLHVIMGSMRLQMYKWKSARFEFNIIEEGDKMIYSLLKLIKTI